MKKFLVAAVLAVLALSVARAQVPAGDPLPPADDLERLVGPIALYPDPLVALILPASTRPAEIVLAARFLDRGGNAEMAQREPWDDSVRALTRYREVVEYLDRNLEWTRRLGEVFSDHPDDVMDAIQSVRARARANGLLPDTPQQEVIVEAEEIRIVPANPTIIYVPRYEPEVIFVTQRTYYPSTWLSFGIGYGVGSWLSYDCDWRYRSVRVMHRAPSWYHRPDWHRRRPEATSWTRWTPRPRREREFAAPSPQLSDYSRRAPAERRYDSAPPPATTPWQRPDAAPRVVEQDRSRDHREHRRSPGQPDYRDGRGGERSPRGDYSHRSPRRTPEPQPVASPVLTAPAIVSTPPPGPTAPAIVSTPPGGFATPAPHPGSGSGFRSNRERSERPPSYEPRQEPRRQPPRSDSDVSERSRSPHEPRAERTSRGERRPSYEQER